jgi:TPR repeat protein
MSFREDGSIVVPDIEAIRQSTADLSSDGDTLLWLYFVNDQHAAENATCRNMAMVYLANAAGLGNRYARYILSCHYSIGRHVRKDLGHSRELIKQLAHEGDLGADELLRRIDRGDLPSCDGDMIATIYAQHRRTAHGESGATVAIASSLLRRRLHREAFALFLLASEEGNAAACYWLAVLYHYGWGVERDPLREAIYRRKAADRGYGRSNCLVQ